jgi:hypothetical protein
MTDMNLRLDLMMPPRSPCSIALTTGYVDSAPGSLKGVQLNVEDADEVYSFLRDRGVDVSEIPLKPLLLLLRPGRKLLVDPWTAAFERSAQVTLGGAVAP